MAERPEEQEALDDRYFRAVTDASDRGVANEIETFEQVMMKSEAVVAMSVDLLRTLATKSNSLYSNYQLTVRAQLRRPALLGFDQHRSSVDGKLWGVAAESIRYAALSLDKSGVASYGDCSVVLKESHIAHRASVLEENAFAFVDKVKHSEPLPLGYRSPWRDRHKLAIAKCSQNVQLGMNERDFASLLLFNGAGRTADDFMEVHIYGPFDFNAVESIRIATAKRSHSDNLSLAVIKQKALGAGKGWIE